MVSYSDRPKDVSISGDGVTYVHITLKQIERGVCVCVCVCACVRACLFVCVCVCVYVCVFM